MANRQPGQQVTEKNTVDQIGVLTGLGVTAARYAAVGLSGFVWTVVVTNSFTQEVAGLLLIVITLPVLIPPLIDLGLPTAIGFLVATSRSEETSILSFGFTYAVRIAMIYLVGLAALLLFMDQVASPVDKTIALGALSVVPALILATAAGFLRGAGRFGPHARYTAAPMVILLVTTAGIVSIGQPDPSHIAVTVAISYALPAIWAIREYDTPKRAVNPDLRKEALAYSIPLYASEAAATLRTRGDIILVGLILGPAAVALFGAGAALAAQLGIIAQAAFVVVFPYAAKDALQRSPSGQLTAFIVRTSIMATAALALILLLLGPGPVEFIFGESYSESWLVLATYLPGVILLSASRVLTSDLSGRGRTRLLFRINLVAAALALVLLSGLSMLWGVTGAALAVSLTALFGTVWRYREFSTETGLKTHELLTPKRSDLVALKNAMRTMKE